MQQYAIFVDAGYLITSAGTHLNGGERTHRHMIKISYPEAVSEVMTLGKRIVTQGRLLRIYWYDALMSGGRSSDRNHLGEIDGVKLRLGHLNSHGQQKGVDSLIVTDMIELARQNSISDAVLIAGDGDLTVAVNIAQTFGTRIHLVGVGNVRGNQSPQLRNEVDTKLDMEYESISKFVSLADDKRSPAEKISTFVKTFVDELSQEDIAIIGESLSTEHGQIPFEFDSKLLGKCGGELERDLTAGEKRLLRSTFRKYFGE